MILQSKLFFSAVILQTPQWFCKYIYNTAILIDRATQTQLCSWLSASISWVYVRSDKQLSLLYDWHLLNVRQAKYLFSAIFVGTNSDCDILNALRLKTMITWDFFSYVFWQWDQYHYLFQIQSDLFVRTPINWNPRYPKQIATNRFPPTQFTPLIWKPCCMTPTWKFRNGYVISIEKINAKPDYANCYLVLY